MFRQIFNPLNVLLSLTTISFIFLTVTTPSISSASPATLNAAQRLSARPQPAVMELPRAPLGIRPATLPAFELFEPRVAEVPAPTLTERATRVPVIEYHYSTFRMGEQVIMKTEWWHSQMQWLADNGFHTLTSDEFIGYLKGEREVPARSVLLRFDVGESRFDDYANIVIPTLRQHGFHGIFFVLASRTDDVCDGKTACWPMLKQWVEEGVISIESHSLWHMDYTTLAPEQIAMDAGRSKAIIEEKLGVQVRGLCYPFDAVNPAAFEILQTLGYEYAVAGYTRADRSVRFGDDEPYNLPSWYPYSHDGLYPIIGSTGGLTYDQMVWKAMGE